MLEILRVRTRTLEIGYEAHGDVDGVPVILLHGFPDDARAWDDVAPSLAAAGYRVLVPYLRGYGPTHFLESAEPRMAQQAAIGQDLLDFMNALGLPAAGLAGYDWGGRAACIVALIAPERVLALVTIGGYNVQNTMTPPPPASAVAERAYWYQWYFNTERGRMGLERNRREICRLLWQEWSPSWRTGTSGISIPSADGWASNATVARSAGSCGRSGRRAGDSTTRPSTARPLLSTIPISCRW